MMAVPSRAEENRTKIIGTIVLPASNETHAVGSLRILAFSIPKNQEFTMERPKIAVSWRTVMIPRATVMDRDNA